MFTINQIIKYISSTFQGFQWVFYPLQCWRLATNKLTCNHSLIKYNIVNKIYET